VLKPHQYNAGILASGLVISTCTSRSGAIRRLRKEGKKAGRQEGRKALVYEFHTSIKLLTSFLFP
jgi:hypothetical protein